MKTLAIVALATLFASPVLAQSYDPDLGTGNIAAPVVAQAPQARFDNAYAQAVRPPHFARQAPANASTDDLGTYRTGGFLGGAGHSY
jgi:hypothetical protein